MSRLYQALKEATHFREAPDGTTGEGVWEALGIQGTADQAVPDVAEASEAVSAPPTAVLTMEAAAISPGAPAVGSVSAPAIGLLGIATKVAVDRKARLLPNAVDPIVVERYRMLRTKILQERENRPFRSLVVTSANPQEGKTVTVLNLAMSFAMLPSFKVLVVDGDMRRGSLGEWLGVDPKQPGLSNLIDGSAQLEEVVLNSDDLPIHFIVRGNSQVSDLHTSQFHSHFRKLVEQFDLVLVDSPPVNLVTDVQLWAASCDAVLLVARAFQTSRKALEEAVQNLQPFRVIGTVLNAGTAKRPSRYSNYY